MKRHFEERLAQAVRIICKSAELDECPLSDVQVDIIIDQLSLICNESDSRFDYGKFRKACKPEQRR